MTQQEAYAALREKVARAMMRDAHGGHDIWERDEGMQSAWLSSADAALAVVKEALGEPTEAMMDVGQIPGWSRWEAHGRWRAMFAHSPLSEAPDAE